MQLLFSSCDENNDNINDNLQISTQALTSTTCTIVLGGGGNSQTITQTFTTTSPYSVNTSANWDFIRSTSGYCKFEIYNSQNLSGNMVTLGSDLSVRIRAGEDGIKNKDSGGGATWKIRSVKLIPLTDNERTCYINIGGNGVRMNYYVGNYAKTPAMDRLTYFLGGNCDAKIWNGSDYGTSDSYRRYQAIHTNAVSASQGAQRPVYDPGYRVRSIELEHHGQYCNSYSYNYDLGRCLPNITLSNSIYADVVGGSNDRDYDGLVDSIENQLAESFRPIVMNDSDETATYINRYTDADGISVIEPISAFQVRKADINGIAVDTDGIVITYMQLWKKDEGVGSCPGHSGDSQAATIILKTPPSPNSNHGKYWWLYAENDIDQKWGSVSVTAYYDSQVASNLSNSINTSIDASNYLYEDAKSISIEEQEKEEKEELSLTGIVFDPFDNSDLFNYEPDLRAPSEKDIDKRQWSVSDNPYDKIILDNNSPVLTSTGVTVSYQWVQGDTRLRGPRFERWGTEPVSSQRHFVMNYSKGKHHQYFDGTASGNDDGSCEGATNYSYANGRGNLHNPSYPKRLLSVRSPIGYGDSYHYNNVGSRDKHTGFLNNLYHLGHSYNINIWDDMCFYGVSVLGRANAADRKFYCSNNLNKLCCLEEYPGCTIPSNWSCH